MSHNTAFKLPIENEPKPQTAQGSTEAQPLTSSPIKPSVPKGKSPAVPPTAKRSMQPSDPNSSDAKTPASVPTEPEAASAAPKPKRQITDYVELIETVARVEYSRLPNHLIDQSELVNIGAIALHVLFTSNPDREYNVTYLSTAIKWAIRNELRYRYKWYALKQVENRDEEGLTGQESSGEDGEEGVEVERNAVREVVYETILSMEGMMEGENPHEIRDDARTPEENTEYSEVAKLIRDAIAKLPEREKMIVEARFFKNMKMREIGIHFNISPSRASRIVQAGLDKIKLELQRRGYTG